jgi:hypothetical protein
VPLVPVGALFREDPDQRAEWLGKAELKASARLLEKRQADPQVHTAFRHVWTLRRPRLAHMSTNTGHDDPLLQLR